MKINKYQNGGSLEKDPPKGYKYNEAGNLVPIDFNEFHEEGGIDMGDLMRGV